MAEYESRYKEIAKGKVSKNLMSKGYATHYSNPSEYFYVHSDDFLLEFDMQQSDTAIIIIHFSGATDMKHKFIVRQINKRWVVDEKILWFLQMKQSGTRIVYKHIYKQKELAARAASSLYSVGYSTMCLLTNFNR